MKGLLIAISFILLNPLHALELDYLYQKKQQSPRTKEEIALVAHAQSSYEKAIKLQSKLNDRTFRDASAPDDSQKRDFHFLKELNGKPYFHLINNLCELKDASHLHVGLLAGDSFIAALYRNQNHMKLQIGLDWFQECPKDIFETNCKKHIDLSKCLILNKECFNLDNIYLYDADHSLMAHEKAITYYHDVFANLFIVVIDDWECPWIRKPTFKAFDKLGYTILYQAYIPGPRSYRSGQYVAVIKK
jgi:hypothetical protein